MSIAVHLLSLPLKTNLLRSILLFLLFVKTHGYAQIRASISTDLSLVRNFSTDQHFWALGQTVQGNFHFSKKETVYAWVNYFVNGKFRNNRTATAKPGQSPDMINYKVKSVWNAREISIRLKHYWIGAFNSETGWNIYSIAGLGLNWTNVENIFTPAFDTAHYNYYAPIEGSGQFTRLTLDLGGGVEKSLGGNFFLYGDLRTALPASDYPSPWTANNKNVPLPLILGFGARILFGY